MFACVKLSSFNILLILSSLSRGKGGGGMGRNWVGLFTVSPHWPRLPHSPDSNIIVIGPYCSSPSSSDAAETIQQPLRCCNSSGPVDVCGRSVIIRQTFILFFSSCKFPVISPRPETLSSNYDDSWGVTALQGWPAVLTSLNTIRDCRDGVWSGQQPQFGLALSARGEIFYCGGCFQPAEGDITQLCGTQGTNETINPQVIAVVWENGLWFLHVICFIVFSHSCTSVS